MIFPRRADHYQATQYIPQDTPDQHFQSAGLAQFRIFESHISTRLTDVPPHLPLNAHPPFTATVTTQARHRVSIRLLWPFVCVHLEAVRHSSIRCQLPIVSPNSAVASLGPLPVPSQFSARRADDLQLHRDVHRATPKPGLDRVLSADIHHSFCHFASVTLTASLIALFLQHLHYCFPNSVSQVNRQHASSKYQHSDPQHWLSGAMHLPCHDS